MSELKTADAPKTAVPLVNLTIDGRPVSVPKGTNVVLAAKKLGIHIPHYCYHEKLSVAGNCRMCLIEMGTPKVGPDKQPVLKPDGTPEISWIPRAQIGCATTVSEGMAIKTNSPMVEDCRKGVMEFLLINHPLDCPICDQAGECQLQEYSVEYGNAESRFVEEKVHKPKQVELGPRVMLDDERCILCSRCIRFSKEIAKDDVLGFTERGSHSTLTCYPGKKLENNYSLNTVDICPVGALTSTDFRFKMRVWFLKETDSICTSCSTGCNTQVSSREGVVYRYTPRRNDAVNSDWMCDYGRLNYKWINSEKRLLEPRISTTDHPSLSGDWNVALTEARRKLQSSPGKFAILASGRSSNEELYLARQLAEQYRAVTTDIVPRHGPADDILLSADRNPNTAGAQLFGLTGSEPGSNLQKIKEGISSGQIRTLLVLDECAVKAGIPIEILGKLENLIVIDILPSETTSRAHILLPGAAHVEKRGTMVNKQKRIQRFQQAFLPKGAARPHWEILNLLRPETHVSTFECLFKEMCSQMPGLQGLDWNAVGEQGISLQSEGAVNRS